MSIITINLATSNFDEFQYRSYSLFSTLSLTTVITLISIDIVCQLVSIIVMILHICGVLQFDYNKNLQKESQPMHETKSFHLDNTSKKLQFEEHYVIHPSNLQIPEKEDSLISAQDEVSNGAIMQKFQQKISSRVDVQSSKMTIPLHGSENLIPEKKIFYSQMLIKDQVTSNFDQFNFRESYQAQSQQDIIRKRLKRYFSYKGKV